MTTAHDYLCRAAELGAEDTEQCDCDVVRRARADERQRIALAIETRRAGWDAAWAQMAKAGGTIGPGTVVVAYVESARIARTGGGDA